MAQHLVKCLYCNKVFDANKEEFVKPTPRRYAHKICADNYLKNKTKEQVDLEELEKYIEQLFQIGYIPPKIKKQIQKFHDEYGYTYSGIRRSLYYFFEIKGNSIDKANNGIGIVPHIYDTVRDYWKTLHDIQESNKDKDVESTTIEVHIASQKREPMRRMRKLFTFLDENEDDED